MVFLSKKLSSDIPWVEKHRPKSIKEMAIPNAKVKGQKVNLDEELRNFVKEFFDEMRLINDENKRIKIFNRTHGEKER